MFRPDTLQEMMLKVQIKKTSDRAKYVLSGDAGWVRDFTGTSGVILSDTYDTDSLRIAVANESVNRTYNLPMIDRESITSPHVVVVSDGTDLQAVLPLVNVLSKQKTLIIGVNNSLSAQEFFPRYYLSNHPGEESLSLIPRQRVLPNLIASCRTNSSFVRKYRQRGGVAFVYVPTPSHRFSSNLFKSNFTIDDYRNPICAAINFAYRWGAMRFTLFAPHDYYSESKAGTQKIRDGVNIYPQQTTAHNYVDGCLYWLREHGCETTAVTSGPIFSNATTLMPHEAEDFFKTK